MSQYNILSLWCYLEKLWPHRHVDRDDKNENSSNRLILWYCDKPCHRHGMLIKALSNGPTVYCRWHRSSRMILSVKFTLLVGRIIHQKRRNGIHLWALLPSHSSRRIWWNWGHYIAAPLSCHDEIFRTKCCDNRVISHFYLLILFAFLFSI